MILVATVVFPEALPPQIPITNIFISNQNLFYIKNLNHPSSYKLKIIVIKLTINVTNQLQKVLLVDQLNCTKEAFQLYK